MPAPLPSLLLTSCAAGWQNNDFIKHILLLVLQGHRSIRKTNPPTAATLLVQRVETREGPPEKIGQPRLQLPSCRVVQASCTGRGVRYVGADSVTHLVPHLRWGYASEPAWRVWPGQWEDLGKGLCLGTCF